MPGATGKRLPFKSLKSRVLTALFVIFVSLITIVTVSYESLAAGPRKEEIPPPRPRYGLPAELGAKDLRFAGERIPLERKDVRSRILSQINFLLLDARSVLSLWLTDDLQYAWIFQEIFQKEGLPKEFVLLAPILSRMKRPEDKGRRGGIWALETPCGGESGVAMSTSDSHDDRMDVDLSTKCFSAQIKQLRKELSDSGWLMTVAAYMSSKKTVEDLRRVWNAQSFWDVPFTESPDVLVPRWIALWLIYSYPSTYDLDLKPPQPITFDQVKGVVLAKDLPIAEVARILGVPPRIVLLLNPKIKPSSGIFSARENGKQAVHTITAPRGKGQLLVKALKEKGYLAAKPGK